MHAVALLLQNYRPINQYIHCNQKRTYFSIVTFDPLLSVFRSLTVDYDSVGLSEVLTQ